MSVIRWSAPKTLLSSLFAIPAGMAAGNRSMVAELDNSVGSTLDGMLYCQFQITLGSFSPSGASSIGLRLVHKWGGATYPDRDGTIFTGEPATIPVIPIAGQRVYQSPVMRLPGPFIFGLELLNNTTANFAASGNSMEGRAWSDEVP
jgi:hypothetical protein